MNLQERIHTFEFLFDELQRTNSRNEKEGLLTYFKRENPTLIDDLNYIFETLAGKHPLHFTFVATPNCKDDWDENCTVKDLIQACENTPDRSNVQVAAISKFIGPHGYFIEPIVNRTLRLGIGHSQLSKSDLTPMLAKKYEGGLLPSDVFITEKLDGNRCLASFSDGGWQFTSRSGKPLNVNFNMDFMDRELIYDGEILSDAQTALSIKRASDDDMKIDTKDSQLLFNQTSGLINRLGHKSGLVYNIFDTVCPLPYYERRKIVDSIDPRADDVRILPVLYEGTDIAHIDRLLDKVINSGGEGLMLNLADRIYEHRRTDGLLKYKKVQFMDMIVTNIGYGQGKYENVVGALGCYIKLEDGREVFCDVGSGLSDDEREIWSLRPKLILGRIVKIGYHEMTQDSSKIGTNMYSLRFPRLIEVRRDKDETSQF
jgi:hypothetical protein